MIPRAQLRLLEETRKFQVHAKLNFVRLRTAVECETRPTRPHTGKCVSHSRVSLKSKGTLGYVRKYVLGLVSYGTSIDSCCYHAIMLAIAAASLGESERSTTRRGGYYGNEDHKQATLESSPLDPP